MREDLLADVSDLDQYIGLTPVEAAAARTSFHMSTCRDPVWECPLCTDELKAIRKHLEAAIPLVLAELEAAGRLLPEPAEAPGG